MSKVKDIVVKVIPASIATPFVKRYHYSGKVVQNSQLHFGCFLDGGLHGVMSFGPSMDKRKIIGLVGTDNKTEATKWNEFIELNRMAFDDHLPRNSESRCLAIAFRLIRKNAPHIKFVVSFSDATASGDGTIYRAAGFCLTQIKKNNTILVMPDGERITILNFTNGYHEKERICKKYGIPVWGGASVKPLLEIGAKFAEGYQLRYIKLLSTDCKFLCPVLPFTAIDEENAGMWRGEKITRAERHEKGRHDSRPELSE
jgi:hypothetical protein